MILPGTYEARSIIGQLGKAGMLEPNWALEYEIRKGPVI